MKKMHITIVMCAVCLLINFKAILAQNIRSQATSQSQLSTTWDGTSWSNGKPNKLTKAIFAHDYKATENLTALDVEVLKGAKVTIEDNVSLNVFNNLTVDPQGKLTLVENAQLLQKKPASPNSVIDVTRKTGFINRFDYTYFSSPVENQQLNLIGDPFFFPNYPNPNGGAYLPPLSDKYYVFESNLPSQGTDVNLFNSGIWTNIPETTIMNTPGKGFIIRGPQSFDGVATVQWNVKFTGEPYTGTKTRQIYGIPYTPFFGALTPLANPPVFPYEPCDNTLYTLNLIGNPYPAIISSDSFLTLPANITNLDGAMYFWTHKNGPTAANGGNGTAALNYTNNDYVVYNLVGGIGGNNRPTGIVPTCQGFIMRGITNTVATFTDDMKNITGTDQMYRLNSSALTTPVTKNRFWVSMELSTGINPPYRETLIGYMPPATTANDNILSSIPGSTNNFEKMYDVEVFKAVYNTYPNGANDLTNRFELYSLLNPGSACPRLVIQGRKLDATFNVNDVVQLGYTCPAGTYTIKGFMPEGLFTTQQFWLKETINNVPTYYDIRNTPYTFTETAAVNDNSTRFQIVFKLPSIPIVTNVPSICGTLLSSIETTIFTNNVPNTTLYSFEVRTDAAFPNGSVLGTYPGNVNSLYPYQFNLNFSTILPSTTYWIRPASYQVNGLWVYGETCQVTTPAIPASCIYNPVSGSITTSTWNRIDARIINNQFGLSATSYRFTATVNNLPFGAPFITPTPFFRLRDIGANQTHINTTFTITVETFWNNAWQPCANVIPYTITTANVITRQSEDGISIFDASTYPNPFANNFKLDINTSSEDQIELVVYDMLGRQMETRTIQVSDLDTQEIGTNYASGVYNLIIKQADNIKTLRVIKR